MEIKNDKHLMFDSGLDVGLHWFDMILKDVFLFTHEVIICFYDIL